MARVYEKQPDSIDLEGRGVGNLDPKARRAFFVFWLSIVGIVAAAIVFYVVASRTAESRNALALALAAAAVALGFLIIMNRSMLSMRLRTTREIQADEKIEKVLEQLDDRFAIFMNVTIGESFIDNLVVGPSGMFVVNSTPALDKSEAARTRINESKVAAEDVADLVESLIPNVAPDVDAVLCFLEGTIEVRQEKDVWLVPAEKIVPALLKRSGQQGAITHNVNKTGAFQSDALQSEAVEQALAKHLKVVPKKTMNDYRPASTP